MSPVVPGRPLRTADPLTSQPLRRHSHRPVRCARAFRSLTFPNSPRLRLRLGWLLILIVGSLASRPTTSRAVPFASSLTNLGGFLSFRLNEPADRVLVVSNSGTQTNDVGSLGGGLQHLSLNVTGQYQILVLNSGPVGFISPVGPSQGARLQVSGDTVRTRFNNPRGIAINTNPRSPYFGRIYVANSSAGAATNLAFGPARNCGDGLYVLNADLSDAVGQGNTALTGGLEFMTNSDLSPYRLSLDAEDRLYICDQSDFSGGVYTVDGDVSARSGTNVLAAPSTGVFPVGPGRNHGSIAAAVPEGTVSSTNLALFVLDEALQVDRNSSVLGGKDHSPHVLIRRSKGREGQLII